MQGIDDSTSTNSTIDSSFHSLNDENSEKPHGIEYPVLSAPKVPLKTINSISKDGESSSSLYRFTSVDISGEGGEGQENEQNKKDLDPNETLSSDDNDDDLDESFRISEIGSDIYSSFAGSDLGSTEDLAELSAALDEKDKKESKKQARLLSLHMYQNFGGLELQIEMLQNANGRLRAELNNQKAENAHLRKTIGRKDAILGEQEKKLSAYEAKIFEMSKAGFKTKLMSNNKNAAFHTPTSRDEFSRKYKKLREEKTQFQKKAIKISDELDKARTELEKMKADAESKSAVFKKGIDNWNAREKALNLELTLKEKELAEKIEQNTVHENKIMALMEVCSRQKEVIEKFKDQNHMVKQKYSELKGKYREVSEQLQKEKKLNAYSIELMEKKALESTRSTPFPNPWLAGWPPSQLGVDRKRRRQQKATPPAEVICIEDCASADSDGSPAPSTSTARVTRVTKRDKRLLKMDWKKKKSSNGAGNKLKKMRISCVPTADCLEEEACREMD